MNKRGLVTFRNKTKISQISDLTKIRNEKIIRILETHLNKKIKDAEIDIEKYNIVMIERG